MFFILVVRDASKNMEEKKLSKTKQKEQWIMPDWMEKYRSLISVGDESKKSSTSIEDLMNDKKTNSFNNIYRYAMIVNVDAKVGLLKKLKEQGLLS